MRKEATTKTEQLHVLTPKAQVTQTFFIQHLRSGDYDFSDNASFREAVLDAISEVPHDDRPEAEKYDEYAAVMKQYSQEEVLEAAREGYGWPTDLGLVEERRLTCVGFSLY